MHVPNLTARYWQVTFQGDGDSRFVCEGWGGLVEVIRCSALPLWQLLLAFSQFHQLGNVIQK